MWCHEQARPTLVDDARTTLILLRINSLAVFVPAGGVPVPDIVLFGDSFPRLKD
jgi:hypothetical protein